MYSPFKYSQTIRAIERANDLIQLGDKSNDNNNSNKRSRDAFQQENNDHIFKEVVKELDYAEVYPTFRTLVLERFYVILSYNTEHDYYDNICKIVVSFKQIITQADKMYYNMTDDQDRKEMCHFLIDNLKRLLCDAQQLILLFHLSAKIP